MLLEPREKGVLSARAATVRDAETICVLYNQGIAGRAATFETRPRTPAEVAAGFDGVHPVVVVEENGAVIAFASTSAYSARECYAGIGEFSVYAAPAAQGRGAGRLAMRALIQAAEAAGLWKLTSRTFVENTASRALLRSAGFREVGIHERHGRLEGRWRDVVIVEKLVMRTILFVCVHNAGRSQMAEAFTNKLAAERGLAVRAISAGTLAGSRINPAVEAVMAEAGVPLAGQVPKALTQEMADQADQVITMGCGVDAEACPARFLVTDDWGLDDPNGQPVETVRAIRDQVRARVEALLSGDRL